MRKLCCARKLLQRDRSVPSQTGLIMVTRERGEKFPDLRDELNFQWHSENLLINKIRGGACFHLLTRDNKKDRRSHSLLLSKRPSLDYGRKLFCAPFFTV